MDKKLSKKSEKVIGKMIEERLFEHPLALVAKTGARACPELDSGTTNTLERAFREVRQRVRVIARFKDEDRALATI